MNSINLLNSSLNEDKELNYILSKEKNRQITSLELIASENFTSKAVLEANGTIFTNKYSEGYPNKRYYGGNEFIDQLEILCQERALKVFNLDPNEWGVNVQSYSGSTANFSVYTGLLNPGEKIMGLDLPSGGHLTHGYETKTKKISNSSIYFTSYPYIVGEDNLIDYLELETRANEFKPNLIIAGASAYSRDFDYSKFKTIAKKNNSYLMADISHISGLIASGLLNNPFKYCDVVTTTTHKTLRGPRAALIFYKLQYKDKIDFAVFPSSQGGPHNNTISAIATSLYQVNTEEFRNYSRQVIKNSQYLANELMNYGFEIITNGTDNHLLLINLQNKKINGKEFETIAELCNISLNKNTIPKDKSAFKPSGIRIGTPAMTTRGFTESNFKFVADMLNEVGNITLLIKNSAVNNTFKDFTNNIVNFEIQINLIKTKIINYCSKFDFPE
jgi:glycine hydroxymethyltransferase